MVRVTLSLRWDLNPRPYTNWRVAFEEGWLKSSSVVDKNNVFVRNVFIKTQNYQNVVKFYIQVTEVFRVDPFEGRSDLLRNSLGGDLADAVVADVRRQVAQRRVLRREHEVVFDLKNVIV